MAEVFSSFLGTERFNLEIHFSMQPDQLAT